MWLQGLTIEGVPLPDLGFYVMPSEIEVNWHGGTDWGEQQVESFFKLLYELTLLDPGCKVVMPEGVSDDYAKSFMFAWHRFQKQV